MLESRYLTDIIFYTAHPKCGERVFCHCIDLSDMDLCKLVCEGFHKEGYTHRTYYLQREDRVYTRLGLNKNYPKHACQVETNHGCITVVCFAY